MNGSKANNSLVEPETYAEQFKIRPSMCPFVYVHYTNIKMHVCGTKFLFQ